MTTKQRHTDVDMMLFQGCVPASFWFVLLHYVPVNSYGHVGTVSSPNHTSPRQA